MVSIEYGGEGGIRTLEGLRLTHFPGVLLRPLGHLTRSFKLRYGMEIFLAAQPNLNKVKVVAHFTSNKLSSYLFLLSSSLKLSMRSNDLNAP